jgi:hypothetical protein
VASKEVFSDVAVVTSPLAAKSLAQMSTHLRGLVGRFKLEEQRDVGQKRRDKSQARATKSEQREEEFVMK